MVEIVFVAGNGLVVHSVALCAERRFGRDGKTIWIRANAGSCHQCKSVF